MKWSECNCKFCGKALQRNDNFKMHDTWVKHLHFQNEKHAMFAIMKNFCRPMLLCIVWKFAQLVNIVDVQKQRIYTCERTKHLHIVQHLTSVIFVVKFQSTQFSFAFQTIYICYQPMNNHMCPQQFFINKVLLTHIAGVTW